MWIVEMIKRIQIGNVLYKKWDHDFTNFTIFKYLIDTNQYRLFCMVLLWVQWINKVIFYYRRKCILKVTNDVSGCD